MINKKIPNKNNFFVLNKNETYRSIDVLFDFFAETDIKNLYLICKSIVLKKQNLLKSVLVIASESSELKQRKIFHNIKIKKIEKISYIDFLLFVEDMTENDWKYMIELGYGWYGFRFIFYKESYNWLENEMFPEYPWNKNDIAQSILNAENEIKKKQ